MTAAVERETALAAIPPQWPALAPALDGVIVRDVLSLCEGAAFLGCDKILSCKVERVHFGSHMGVIVDYQLETKSDDQPVRRLKAFGQIPWTDPDMVLKAAIAKLQRRNGASNPGSNPSPIILLPELGMLFRAAGVDERIEGLSLLAGSAAASDLASEVEAAGVPARNGAVLLAHRLGKRAVLRFPARHEAPGAILKLYKSRSDTAVNNAAIQAELVRQFAATNGMVRIPNVRKVMTAAPGMLMEDAAGGSFDMLSERDRPSAMRLAGAAAAILHSVVLSSLGSYKVTENVLLLEGWVAFISGVCPQQAARFGAALEKVRLTFSGAEPSDVAPIHRDFHERQLLWRNDSAVLLDFDTICLGDPAQDIGNFLAHLRFLELLTGRSTLAERLHFMDGYEHARRDRQRRVQAATIKAHESATLLRLAMINWFSESRRHVVDALLEKV